MSFDLEALRAAVAEHGAVTRVAVAGVEGSAPREPGASMLVWDGGQSGTIGGGALEFQAARAARKGAGLRRVPLGPGLGQCCGGAVVLLAERFTAADLDGIADPYLRRVEGTGEVPLNIRKVLAQNRNSGEPVAPLLAGGWMVEPLSRATRRLWIYGAGHVGRALVGVLSALPDFAITWIDSAADRFPADIPQGVTQLVAANPADAVAHAPADAGHLVLTYSHALDLEICHRLLGRGFDFAGLIGSKTKWARFRSRLVGLGHAPAEIGRITCPIGNPALGKHPQAIAISVAAGLMSDDAALERRWGDIA